MKIVVFGATAGTGRQVARRAIERGDDVTVAARRPESVAAIPELAGARVVAADVTDAASSAAAIAGADVVVSTVGPRGRGATNVYSCGAENLVAAAREHRVPRVVVLSATGIDPGPLPFPLALFARYVLQPVLRGPYDDVRRMEAALAHVGDVDWTVVRPPRLTDAPRRGKYRLQVDGHLHHATSIGRADLADAVLDVVADTATHRRVVEVAY